MRWTVGVNGRGLGDDETGWRGAIVVPGWAWNGQRGSSVVQTPCRRFSPWWGSGRRPRWVVGGQRSPTHASTSSFVTTTLRREDRCALLSRVDSHVSGKRLARQVAFSFTLFDLSVGIRLVSLRAQWIIIITANMYGQALECKMGAGVGCLCIGVCVCLGSEVLQRSSSSQQRLANTILS